MGDLHSLCIAPILYCSNTIHFRYNWPNLTVVLHYTDCRPGEGSLMIGKAFSYHRISGKLGSGGTAVVY
jgi:hypothetical protein